MSAIRTDVSPAGLSRAVEENMFVACGALYSHMPGAEYHDTPDMMRWATGLPHPILNGATRARLTPENADAQIAETIALFRAKGAPAMWWHDPSSQPTDLGQRLIAHGFTQGNGMPGMAADLHKAQNPLPSNPALAVAEVRDDAGLKVWTDICCRSFGMSEEIRSSFFASCSHIGYGADRPMRNFLCTLNGEPAACASLCIGAGIAGIYCVGTIAEARRQGCGAAVTQACLDAAREQGYRIAILQASKMGEPVYQRLGFETVCRIETYFWAPPS